MGSNLGDLGLSSVATGPAVVATGFGVVVTGFGVVVTGFVVVAGLADGVTLFWVVAFDVSSADFFVSLEGPCDVSIYTVFLSVVAFGALGLAVSFGATFSEGLLAGYFGVVSSAFGVCDAGVVFSTGFSTTAVYVTEACATGVFATGACAASSVLTSSVALAASNELVFGNAT